MDVQQAIKTLAQGRDLTRGDMQDVMGMIMGGESTPAQIGAFLVALHIKGETVEEIVGAATMMRELAAKVDVGDLDVVDTVGTGGDVAHLFNVSTASAFVTAAAGAKVAKHGNRAATSRSGSADVLEASGVNIALTPDQVALCIKDVGIGFMFAPTHHSATRHAVGPRREIGVRSVFNVLGPLTNPAGARRQLVGVYDHRWVRPLTEVFQQLGSRHTLVVHSVDGLDEVSLAAQTHVAELKNGEISEFTISPEQFGIELQDLKSMVVDSAEGSLALIESALGGYAGPCFDMVALNAGATIYVAGLADSVEQGIKTARDVLSAGGALDKMKQLAEYTQAFVQDERNP